MRRIQTIFAVALIACAAAIASAQISTTVSSNGEKVSRTYALSFKVNSGGPSIGGWTYNRISYAIEEEMLSTGFFQASGNRAADLVVTYRVESKSVGNREMGEPSYAQGRLIIEIREATTDRTVWRGVADWKSGETAVELYGLDDKLAKAARMLVRRFEEEGLAS